MILQQCLKAFTQDGASFIYIVKISIVCLWATFSLFSKGGLIFGCLILNDYLENLT